MGGRPGVTGAQEPRIFTGPTFARTAGDDAIELAAIAGLELDPWQQFILRQGLGEREDGSWSSFEVVTNVPRQNGKGGVIEARELAGLFLLGEELIIHSAHEFKTATEAFRRIVTLIERTPELKKRVAHVWTTTGKECVELKTGQRLRFLARSKGSGRGFTADCNILDECMVLGADAMDALMPTMAAVRNPQIWYLGSAGIGDQSEQLGSLRRRALNGGDAALSYMEWSCNPHVDECLPGCTEHDDSDNPLTWAKANPALGIRLSEEHIERERLSLSATGFARERLGVGEYPSDGSDAWRVVDEKSWRALTDGESQPGETVVFAVDTTPERSHSAISVASPVGNATHVEVIDHRPGTSWVAPRIAELVERWAPKAVVIDAGGPAGSLIVDIEKEGVEVTQPKVREIAQACAQFYDSVVDQSLVHLDQAPLAVALAGADMRPLSDAWAWARRGVSVDISPLMAVTLAAWGLRTYEEQEEVEPWVDFG